MLAVKTYPQEYIDECRARMEAQLAAYRSLVAAADEGDPSTGIRAAVDSFEPLFFNHMVLVLDQYFVHRTRAIEGKDGNLLNEVRMLCSSILENRGVLAADKTVKYKADDAVLKLEVGDEIRVDEARFGELAKAYFFEIEKRFT
jgi:hypothetical protein